LTDPKSDSLSNRLLQERDPFDQAGIPGGGRHLHPPRLLPTYRKEVGAADMGADWPGGFFAPATARDSTSLRAYSRTCRRRSSGDPAHQYLSDARLLIGVDPATDHLQG